jgi:hypothetical protein
MSSSVNRFPPYVDLTTRVGGVGDLAGGANGLTAILAFEVVFFCKLASDYPPKRDLPVFSFYHADVSRFRGVRDSES